MNNNKKHDWYSLSKETKIESVLALQNKGLTAEEINNYFDIKSNRVIRDFMYKRGYKRRDNKYIHESIINAEEENKAIESLNSINSMNTVPNLNIINVEQIKQQIEEILGTDTIEGIKELLANKEKIIALVEERDKRTIDNIFLDNIKENNIALEDALKAVEAISALDGKEVNRVSIRVNTVLLEEFKSLWKRKFYMYKQYDILSFALLEFINKYK